MQRAHSRVLLHEPDTAPVSVPGGPGHTCLHGGADPPVREFLYLAARPTEG